MNPVIRKVEIESKVPSWNGAPAATQRFTIAVGFWGPDDVPASRTILAVHGLTGNLHYWDSPARLLMAASPASPPMRLIAFDLRGRGNSDRPVGGSYHVAAHAADCVGLLDALGIRSPVAYIGHSLGTFVGVYLASHFPGRVHSLALVDGGAVFPPDTMSSISAAVNRLGKTFPDYESFVAPLKASGAVPNWGWQAEAVYRYDAAPAPGSGCGVVSRVDRDAVAEEIENLRLMLKELYSWYPNVRVPTVVMRATVPTVAGNKLMIEGDAIEAMIKWIAGGVKIVDMAGKNHYTVMFEMTDNAISEIMKLLQ